MVKVCEVEVGVAGGVGRDAVHGVGDVGREVGDGEGRVQLAVPVTGEEHFGAAGEGGAVPVVAGALADADGARGVAAGVGDGAADARRGAAGVPAAGVVERRRRAGTSTVDRGAGAVDGEGGARSCRCCRRCRLSGARRCRCRRRGSWRRGRRGPAGGAGGGEEDLGGAGEGGAVPVVAGALADADGDRGEGAAASRWRCRRRRREPASQVAAVYMPSAAGKSTVDRGSDAVDGEGLATPTGVAGDVGRHARPCRRRRRGSWRRRTLWSSWWCRWRGGAPRWRWRRRCRSSSCRGLGGR